MNIGSKIVELRKQKNMTTNKLANRAGIAQSYLRQVELGNTIPTIEKLSYILEVLNVSLKDFFDEDKDNNDLISLINKLNDDEKEIIINLINVIVNKR